MQQRLGIAARLGDAFKDEGPRSEISDAVKTRRHGRIAGIVLVLRIDLFGHALERLVNLLLRTNAVEQPVRHMLGGNPQGRAVFHQADVGYVRHYGTADALIDPAHHITKNALRIVIQLVANVLFRPVRSARERYRQ